MHIMMFLAWMLYGAMPAQSALSAPAWTTISVPGSAHDEHVMLNVEQGATDSGDPCPHRETTTHAPFCVSCLVLIPYFQFAEKGRSEHASPEPEFQLTFLGHSPAPPRRPPRA